VGKTALAASDYLMNLRPSWAAIVSHSLPLSSGGNLCPKFSLEKDDCVSSPERVCVVKDVKKILTKFV